MELDIINQKNKTVGKKSVPSFLTTGPVNKALLYLAVKKGMAGFHHGTVKTKTRAEVLRTGKKVYRQKGTGNARHGSMKTMPFVGGGRVFGPRPRDYAIKLNQKTRQRALGEAFKDKLLNNKVTIIDELPFKEPKTKEAKKLFDDLKIYKALVLLDEGQAMAEKSIRNLKDIDVMREAGANAYTILSCDHLVLTAKAYDLLSKRMMGVKA